MNNSKILFEDHFKIYVLLKDKLRFEQELEKESIDYFCEADKQPMIADGIRYILLDSDSSKIDKIFIENGIIASTETIPTSDYRDGKLAQKLYFKIFAIVLGIMILIVLIDSLRD